jgi:hypothetical protein
MAVAVALGMVVSACSSGSAPTNASSGPGASAARQGTGSATQAPADPFAQTFSNGLACPVARIAPVPQGAGCTSDVRADLDGDGRPDRLIVFASLDDRAMPVSWHAVAVLGSGTQTPVARIPFGAEVEGQSDVYPRVIGAYDADGDGRAEVFVKLTGIVYHIAVSHIVGMFRLDGGGIRQVEIEGPKGPEPWHFFTGGTSRRGQAVVCASRNGRPALLVRLIEVVPPERWRWSEQTLLWRDGLLYPSGPRRQGFYPQSVSIADPRVVAFFKLRCGSVELE